MAPLTQEKIVEIIGKDNIAAHEIKEIIDTGATEAELLEAFQRWVRAGAADEEIRRSPGPRVMQLIDILSLDERQWDEA